MRETQIPYDFIHTWNLCSNTNEQKDKKKTGKP